MSLWLASNVTVSGGSFESNMATANGAHILANSPYTNLAVTGPLVFTDGNAENHGGAVHVANGASVNITDAELSVNRAAVDGGALSAIGAGSVSLVACNVSSNSCGGSGGGVSVVRSAFWAYGSNFTGNEAGEDGGGLKGFVAAELEVEGCRFDGNHAKVLLFGTVDKKNCVFFLCCCF